MPVLELRSCDVIAALFVIRGPYSGHESMSVYPALVVAMLMSLVPHGMRFDCRNTACTCDYVPLSLVDHIVLLRRSPISLLFGGLELQYMRLPIKKIPFHGRLHVGVLSEH